MPWAKCPGISENWLPRTCRDTGNNPMGKGKKYELEIDKIISFHVFVNSSLMRLLLVFLLDTLDYSKPAY